MAVIRRPNGRNRAKNKRSLLTTFGRNIVIGLALLKLLIYMTYNGNDNGNDTAQKRAAAGLEDVLSASRVNLSKMKHDKNPPNLRATPQEGADKESKNVNDDGSVAGSPEDGNDDGDGSVAGSPEDGNDDGDGSVAGSPEDGNDDGDGSVAGPPEDGNDDGDGSFAGSPKDGNDDVDDRGDDVDVNIDGDTEFTVEDIADMLEDQGDDEYKDNISKEDDDGVGNRVFDYGYISDYQYERRHEPFRNVPLPQVSEWEEKVFALTKKARRAFSCQYYESHKLLLHSNCSLPKDTDDDDKEFIFYNNQSFARTVCGTTIEPQSAERMKLCSDMVPRLSIDKQIPDDSKIEKSSIIIRGESSSGNNKLTSIDCDVPCQEESNIGNSVQRKIDGTNWKFIVSNEDPFNKDQLKVEPTDYRKDHYYSTVSFKSSIPLSYFSFDTLDIRTPAIEYDTATDGASYLVSEKCKSGGSRRDKWFAGVKGNYPVMSFGGCDHNTDLPEGLNLNKQEDRLQLLKTHRFNLAFETSKEKDYITDIVWEALQSGTIPIVLGAQNIKDHVPKNSIISANDFQYPDALGKYVKKVAEDKALWESYHAWRTDPKEIQAFTERYNFVKTNPTCRMCRWAYAKKNGFGWNHVKQEILPEKAGSVCLDAKKQLIARPFVETWNVDVAEMDNVSEMTVTDDCNSPVDGLPIQVGDSHTVHRSVVEHDGITDMLIHGIDRSDFESNTHKLVVRLKMQVENVEGAHFPNPHKLVKSERSAAVSSIAMQDEKTRITVLANWVTKISCPEEGIVDISMDDALQEDDSPKQIRVIIEDISAIEQKMTEFYPSTFSQQMIQDFVEPVLLFYMDSR